MGLLKIILYSLSLLSFFDPSFQSTLQNQSHFFTLMKASFSGGSISQWNSLKDGDNFCNYPGIGCDNEGYVVKIDISNWSLFGNLPAGICSYLEKLRVLRLAHNHLYGGFPTNLLNCSFLEELNLSNSHLTGTLPDFSPLKSLRVLDLSFNLFTGNFPMSITNLTSLEFIDINTIGKLSIWSIPDEIARLTNLKRMVMATCSLHGRIPPSIGNMTSLVFLQLSENSLVGGIPAELAKLKNLQYLFLFNNPLKGEIPEELGNLTEILELDLSINQLTGRIPETICRLPKLSYLQLYNNSLTGEIPHVLGNSTSLTMVSVYQNFLTGELPPKLGEFSELVGVDVSENTLRGELPQQVCKKGKLIYFLMLDNQFSGQLPPNLAECKPLLRFRVSNNHLSGSIPGGLFGLPCVSIIDLAFNHFEGTFPKSIRNAKNLSELYIQSNRISGSIPTEISEATKLVKIDLSSNLLSGPIPSEIGDLRKLNLLLLQYNKLDSSIPESLSSLKSLNLLNLSNNLLSGHIPESLCGLLPNSLDFSNNRLSGPVPLPLIREGLMESFSGNLDLCIPVSFNSSAPNLPLCLQPGTRKRINTIWVMAISVFVVILGFLLFLKRRYSQEKVANEHDGFSKSSFCYEMKSFHRLNFNQQEIIESLIDKNIVGYGGSGTVYKIELSNGESVAVKKLWTRKMKNLYTDRERPLLDRELRAEVEILGNIRHKNIVKLYCHFSNPESNLLVYEYMPNGNLWDMLHRGKVLLDWPTRHRIALGIAQGLAYLHHDLLQPIVHRDIKPTNILLNADFQPKVADFGVAKVLQAGVGRESTTTVIAGTCGYLAPEYAYSSKATTNCDVYSFGVVLMELITGKKPIEVEFGENKNIIFWVAQKVTTKEGLMEVLDKRLSDPFKDEMIQALRIAIRCTCSSPAHRPTMNEVVQMLIDRDPCRFDTIKSSDKPKD